MKKWLFFIVVMFASESYAQLVYNRGAGIFIQPGAFVIVKTNAVHNVKGYLENAGQFVIEGNITNDDSLLGGVASPTGNYQVLGDWINNATVISNSDTVELYGNNQRIGGTVPTVFHSLFTSGPATAVKTQSIDAYVNSILNLNDVELATNQFNMVVLNPDVNAILNNKTPGSYGFVSSLDTGKLVRYTNSAAPYFYPLGTPTSTGFPFYYRPIDVRPTAVLANAFGVRLVKDPTANAYDVNDMDNVLCKVNPLFYHNIAQMAGATPADLKFYFDANNDKKWTDVAHWQAGSWNFTAPATSSLSGGMDAIEIKNWSNFNPFPFALASKKFTVDAGPDQELYAFQATTLNPLVTTTNVKSYAWTPTTFLDFPDVKTPTAKPAEAVVYFLTVTDNLGCVISDSLRLTIKQAELLIPTAFSPNKDGVNDVFRVTNDNVSQITFQVFNRWGEKVFESTDQKEGWDGTYRDEPQELGVYVWKAEYKLSGAPTVKFASGNVTLVR